MQRWEKGAIAFVSLILVATLVYPEARRFLERLVIPGPVIEGHVKFERQCEKCHEPFSRATQSNLCLECHKEIASDRRTRSRFHGKQSDALNLDCRACHTEHKGRTTDIMQLDPERFDHNLTNYRLVDSHKTVECNACHARGKPFHKTGSQCVDCHKKADPHKGRLGDRCENCHSPTIWRNVKAFDHGKTKFPLIGAHKDVACATCHTGELYKDLSQACVSCHRIQDIHADRYGSKCETCHNQLKWKEAKFEHDKTKFPLHGAHEKVKCDVCHTGYIYKQKLETTCVACHKEQDPHKGQLGDRCERCHNDVDWRKNITFDHSQTHFPLIGEHVSVPCEGCHSSSNYKDAPIACESCHRDSFHQGRLGVGARCGNCHNPYAWSRWTFDHARQTRYPLTGMHQRLTCESCHSTKNATTLKLPITCESCHKDYHNGLLGAQPKCGSCHDTSAWSHWRFDHGRQTGYPLVGAHARLRCERCHTTPNTPTLKIASDCASCHRRDDPHVGQFGRSCERCHNPVSWRKADIRN
ncbi:hypothetical protein MJC1_04073 [Methylocystis sp. MJC1]|nr:hypothetical protein MJC1_04073 [Methylocystis sp. MJC1]